MRVVLPWHLNNLPVIREAVGTRTREPIDMMTGTEYPYDVQTILQQLQAARERLGWTMDQLNDALFKGSGIKLDRSSLRRQMVGETKMPIDVAEALAHAMSVTLAVVPKQGKRAS